MSDKRITYKATWVVIGLPLVIALVYIGIVGFDKPEVSNYQYPVDNIRSITGTFGELRPNHFHSGMDIRIGGVIGTPIHATNAGYVYRIRVNPYGFGKALYLRHQDGQYSVYAHMSGFIDEIADKVYQRQMATRQSEQEIFLKPNEISIQAGELLGYGGNSGSSLGPHLHFEIRDPQERILNPMSYFKDELSDHISPIVREIAFEPLNDQARIYGKFEKFRIKPYKQGGTYFVPGVIPIQGQVGLEYRAFDFLDAARFRCGINFARLYLDQRLIHELDLKRFSFSETRYINQHVDYSILQLEKERLQKAYIDQGNRFSAYKNIPGKGVIELKDDEIHQFRLELEDYHGNLSVVRGNLQRAPATPFDDSQVQYTDQPLINYDIKRNVLVFSVDCPAPEMKEGLTVINEMGLEVILEPVYASKDAFHYLYPLDSLMYPFAVVDHKNVVHYQFDFKHLVSSNQSTTYKDQEIQLQFPKGVVYQDVHLRFRWEPASEMSVGRILYLGDPRIPLHRYFTLNIRIPDSIALTDKHFIAFRDGDGDWNFMGNERNENRWLSARVRDFGTYAIMKDTLAPSIRPVNFIAGKRLGSGQQNLRISVKDDFSGIVSKNIYCTWDGEWVPIEYEYKYDQIIYKFHKRPSPGEHEFLIQIEDEVGNQQIRGYRIVI